MSEQEYNRRKLPPNVFDGKLHKPVPPHYVGGETFRDGSHCLRYCDPNIPRNSSVECMKPDGSFEIDAIGPELKKGYNVRRNNELRVYTSGGSGSHTDGHENIFVGATSIENVGGSVSRSSGGTVSDQSGRRITIDRGFAQGQIPASSADKYTYVSGTSTTRQDGDRFEHIDGDTKFSIGGSKYETVGGEYGKNIQGGNFDIQVDAGKARLKVSNEILIESGEKITLKVGSSTITITSGNIVIQSARVDINP